MPVNGNRKGKRVERAAAAFFRDLGYPGARRSQQYMGTESSADLTVPGLEWLHVEVKGDKGIRLGTKALDEACQQAAQDCGKKRWVVMWWEERRGWRWTLTVQSVRVTVTDWHDALDLAKKERRR
jgi:hypothetical protein